jgi:hypothetical protein
VEDSVGEHLAQVALLLKFGVQAAVVVVCAAVDGDYQEMLEHILVSVFVLQQDAM